MTKAPFGGLQTGERLFMGNPYDKNSVIDNVLELGAGPHDALSRWNYENKLINGKLTTVLKK